MRKKAKNFIRWFLAAGFFLLSAAVSLSTQAGGPYFNNYGRNYYPNYPASVVIVQPNPLIIPRYGSNDFIYESDNVYGIGASAAGRMDRVVVNPQPQFYIVPPYRGF